MTSWATYTKELKKAVAVGLYKIELDTDPTDKTIYSA